MNGGWKVKPTAVIQRYAFKVICNSSSSMEVLSYFFCIQHLIKNVCRATNVGDFFIATYLLLTYLPFRRIIFDRMLYFVILWNINFLNSNLFPSETILHVIIIIMNIVLFEDNGACLSIINWFRLINMERKTSYYYCDRQTSEVYNSVLCLPVCQLNK